jgi:hypothetical protein
MNTKELLFLVGGVALGYLAFKQFSKEKGKTTEVATAPTGEAGVNPKQVECEKQLQESLTMVRVSDLEGYKNQFMVDCLSGTGMFSPEENA